MRLVLISTDNRLNINEFRDALGATWQFLSGPDRVIQKDLDIKEFTDEPHDPMIPHTFVLGPGLEIFKVYNGYWYWAARRWRSCTCTCGLCFRRFVRTSTWGPRD